MAMLFDGWQVPNQTLDECMANVDPNQMFCMAIGCHPCDYLRYPEYIQMPMPPIEFPTEEITVAPGSWEECANLHMSDAQTQCYGAGCPDPLNVCAGLPLSADMIDTVVMDEPVVVTANRESNWGLMVAVVLGAMIMKGS